MNQEEKDYFILSFLPKQFSLTKILPLVLLLFLLVSLPLLVFLVKQRQGAVRADLSWVCAGEKIEADRDLSNLSLGETVNFTGFGKTTSNQAIDKIKFLINRDGNIIAAQEIATSLDRQEENWSFYRASFAYVLEDYGNYEVAIRVACPDGWKN